MHYHSDEDEYWTISSSNSVDDDSVSDDNIQPLPYWDVVRHKSKFASYRFIIVYPDGKEANHNEQEATKCEPSIEEDEAASHTVLKVLPARVPPDDWGRKLRTPPPPVHHTEDDNKKSPPPPTHEGCAWESHRLQQSLGLSIPQPPPPVEEPPPPATTENDGDWCVMRNNKGKRSLLRNNIAPIARNENTTDRRDLLCKLSSHRNGSCQRAHNMSEWRPKECRRNGCRQTNCPMLHPATEDRVRLLNRLIGIQGTFYHQHAQDFRRLYLDSIPRRPPSRRGGRGGGRGNNRR